MSKHCGKPVIRGTCHEWVQLLPLADNRLRCTLCGAERHISESAATCIPQLLPLSWMPKP